MGGSAGLRYFLKSLMSGLFEDCAIYEKLPPRDAAKGKKKMSTFINPMEKYEPGSRRKGRTLKQKRATARRGAEKAPKYLEFIRSLVCEACYPCGLGDHVQANPTEAAHVGSRGVGQKCSDYETIPLCSYHHRTGPEAHHVIGKAFWEHHGIDRDALPRASGQRKSVERNGLKWI